MDLLILPGNASSNKRWTHDVEKEFAPKFQIHEVAYAHWSSGMSYLQLDIELARLKAKLPKGPYAIVAKSAGSLLAIYGIYLRILKPEWCVFVGLPLAWAQDHDFDLDKWMVSFNIPALVVQQDADPIAPFAKVAEYLGSRHPSISLVSIPGNDHWYGPDSFRAQLESFCAKFKK